MTRFTHGVATASWIDQAVRLELAAGPSVPKSLPKNDGMGPPRQVVRAFFQACQGFRFANFLEAGIEVENGRIIQAGFTFDSRAYLSPSLMGRPSHGYSPLRTMKKEGGDYVFTQIVGARTVAQEEIGGAVGEIGAAVVAGPAGALFGRSYGRNLGQSISRMVTPFAPIWSELELRLSPSGKAISLLKRFSLFPSLTYYEQASQSSDTMTATLAQSNLSYGPPRYDAGQAAMKTWFNSGWGPLRGGVLGPTPGNPWNIKNDGTDAEHPNAMLKT